MDPRRTQYQTDAQGRRTAVVLPIAEYEQLLEDLHDLAVIAERRDEQTVDEAELRRRLAASAASPSSPGLAASSASTGSA